MADEIEVRAKRHGDSAIGTTNPARNQGRHQKIAAAAAILLRNRHTSVALLGQALPEPGRKIIALFNLLVMGSDLFSSKVKRTLIRQLMLFWEFKVHRESSFPTVQRCKGRQSAHWAIINKCTFSGLS